jgi:hypothetical protein
MSKTFDLSIETGDSIPKVLCKLFLQFFHTPYNWGIWSMTLILGTTVVFDIISSAAHQAFPDDSYLLGFICIGFAYQYLPPFCLLMVIKSLNDTKPLIMKHWSIYCFTPFLWLLVIPLSIGILKHTLIPAEKNYRASLRNIEASKQSEVAEYEIK